MEFTQELTCLFHQCNIVSLVKTNFTSRYYITPGCPEALRTLNPALKVILIVRDPFKRLISDYHHVMRLHSEGHFPHQWWTGDKPPTFREMVFREDGEVFSRIQTLENTYT